MKRIMSCGILLFREQPEKAFLLMRHPKRWDLPKGHVDAGETEMECALREMEEETGFSRDDVTIDDGFRFTTEYEVRYKRFDNEKRLKTLVMYLGELKGNSKLKLTEHEGYQWFRWQPPHQIQKETIDPLLAAVAKFWESKE